MTNPNAVQQTITKASAVLSEPENVLRAFIQNVDLPHFMEARAPVAPFEDPRLGGFLRLSAANAALIQNVRDLSVGTQKGQSDFSRGLFSLRSTAMAERDQAGALLVAIFHLARHLHDTLDGRQWQRGTLQNLRELADERPFEAYFIHRAVLKMGDRMIVPRGFDSEPTLSSYWRDMSRHALLRISTEGPGLPRRRHRGLHAPDNKKH